MYFSLGQPFCALTRVPEKSLKRIAWGIVFAALLIGCATIRSGDDWVTVINATYPTGCAEEDNVYVKLVGNAIQTFRIEALHPAYIDSLGSDRSAPDFSGCSFDGSANAQDPVFTFTPWRRVLWESDELLVNGITLERFWRAQSVDVNVLGEQQGTVHLVQVFLKDKHRPKQAPEEFLVFYPTDGYWRLKPLAAPHLKTGAYGTSFLVGPIEEALRPVVDLAKVEFIPATRTFELDYRDGSHGSMKIVEINQKHAVLNYSHNRPSTLDGPFAAVRSMYVAADNADVSQVTFRRPGARDEINEPLAEFRRADVQTVRLGRTTLSRHNASAPDMWFGRFERQ